MSQDTKEITTPGGHKVVIRNYTTHGDDKQAEAILHQGMTVQTGPDGKPQVSISAEATTASSAKYVELLVESIDGNGDNIGEQLDGLRSEDYKAIDEAVKDVTSMDPKATSKS